MSAHYPGSPTHPPKRGHKAGWQDEQNLQKETKQRCTGGHSTKQYTEQILISVTAASHPPVFQGEGGCHKEQGFPLMTQRCRGTTAKTKDCRTHIIFLEWNIICHG